MKITGIEQRRKGLCCVKADGEEFLINSDTVAKAALKEGDEISGERMEQLLSESDYQRAKSRALWYLSRGEHTCRALYTKLCRAFPPQAAQSAIDRMCELGLLDDLRYARNAAETLAAANISGREILRKLFVKGVPNEIAKQAVEELSPDAASQIAALLQHKYFRQLESEDGVQKVYAALLRKGFSYSDVKSALREYSEKLDNCEE